MADITGKLHRSLTPRRFIIAVATLVVAGLFAESWMVERSETERRFAQTCLAYIELNRGFIDWKNATPEELKQRWMSDLKAKSSVANLQRDFQLMTEDSIVGREFRWGEAMKNAMNQHCDYALSKREPAQIHDDLKSIASQYLQSEPK